MTTKQLKDLYEARPFKPFNIHLADGEVLPVKHPEFMWIHPGGRTLCVARGTHEEDGTAIVDLLLVTQLTTGNGRRTRRKKK